MVFAWIAVIAAGLFAGAALYITLVEHPARIECGIDIAVAEFRPSYRRASVMQASLAVIGLLAGIAAWVSLQQIALLIGALLLGAVIPFTLIVIRPTNKQLLSPTRNVSAPAAAVLLAQWQRLHAVRTILSLAAFGLLVWCVLSVE
jgi:uncharacterized membrane protein